MQAKCNIGFSIEKSDDEGFTIPNSHKTIKEGSVWDIEGSEYRFIGGEVRLTRNTPKRESWIEISKETFEECFEVLTTTANKEGK